MEYLAHFDREKGYKQPLNEHLKSVAKLIYAQILPTVRFETISNALIRELSKYMGYFHDMGKYSDYFQKYLQEGKDSCLKNHAHISACILYNFLLKEIQDFEVDEKEKQIIVFLYYICTRRHHSSLRVEAALFSGSTWNNVKLLGEHLSDKAKLILDDLGINEVLDLKEFYNCLSIVPLERNKLLEYMPTKFRNGRIRDSKWYFMLIYIFSLLIDTDKFDSARIKPYDPKLIHYERVTEYLKLKRKNDTKSALNDKREKARLSMLQVINNLTDEEIKNTYFFTLTAPTGIGKTLSSLQCALYLQNRIKEIEGYNPKIIVAIPFINIIEQNKLEYQNVFKDDVRMIAHYSLSDFTSNVSLNEDTPLDKALMLTESWDGDVILTTFVQLFQSIFTGGNRPLKKINKLAGSIVILDEVQSLPQEYMPLIGATLQLLAKYYGTKFILMTATQPKILEFGKMLLSNDKIDIENEEIQLLPDYESYFMELSRTKFVPILDKVLDNEEFIELFFKKWPTDKSALVVANTIKKSIEIYEGIKRKLQEKKLNVPVYYLSTNIIPLKRKEVIFEVRSLLEKNEPVILVSTQTIEAGVDLDFDMAFRDFAPIDSLIQTAGRVNRSGRKGNYLPVYIVQLGNDNQYVYGLSHRKHTEYLLKGKNEILENEYGKLAEEYYQLALNDGVDDKSIEIWDGMMKLDFEAVEKFRLIKNIEEVCDVFVEINEFASSLADAFEKVLSYDGQSNFDYDLSNVLGENYASKFNGKLSPFEIKAILRLIKAKMNDFIIQVRISRMLENKPLEFKVRGEVQCDLYWIPPEDVSRYYDENTGFIDKSGKALIY